MNAQELLWKYVEGNCNPAESAEVEKLLLANPSLQKELDSILEVQSVLVSMEPDKPSLRFTQNVLDALPDIYHSELSEPLIKPIWKKVFWLTIAALLVGMLLLPRSASPSGGFALPYVDQVMDSINQVVGQVPNVVLQYFVLTLLSIGLLMLMDKMFLKRVRGLMMV